MSLPAAVRRARRALLALPLAAVALPAQPAASRDLPDSALVARIEDEGFNRSQVMDVMSWLTDVHGPRLTGSPATRRAAEWALKTMSGWGLSNVKLETWGPFGRGWTSDRFSLQAIEPQQWPVIAYPSAWTPGTNGPVTGEAVFVQIDSAPDFAKYRGKLRGKFVLTGAPRELRPHFEPEASRLTDARLDQMAQAQPAGQGGQRGGRPGGPNALANFAAQRELAAARNRFFAEEGVAAVLTQGQGDGGTVFVSSAGGSRDAASQPAFPTVVLAAEHYGRIARTLAKSVAVKLVLDAKNTWYDADPSSFNIVAEIPGTDPKLKDEVVMVGAHFDTWHTGTGATDNSAGTAVMMEALRILKASKVPLKRTVRIGLWTGEEQGLLGSRAWVREKFGAADSTGLKQTAAQAAAHGKFSAYFNVDNGTGKIRGVYLQGNEAAAPVFDAWMTPFKARGMRTLTIANTGGTDHLSFDALGLPGFQFIQDPVEYGSRTHHSNMDVYERVQADDMKWNSVVVATFAMQAANRAERFPRKPAPAAAARTTSQR